MTNEVKTLKWTYYDRDFTFETTDPEIDLHTDKVLKVDDINIVYNGTDMTDYELRIHILGDWFNQNVSLRRIV